MKNTHDIIILLSGGIDSSACISYYLKQGFRPLGVFIDYGQSVAKRELKSAKKITKYYKIKLDTIKILLSRHYEDGEVKGRNALFLLAVITKYSDFVGIISLGIHSGVSYYDTTEQFIVDMQKVVTSYSDGRIILDMPFLNWSKPMIYQYCIDNCIPVNLTYSCEKSCRKPCGECNSCLDRRKFNACKIS